MPWPLSQDYNEAVQSPNVCFHDAELKQGEAINNALGLPMPRSGNFADVYEFKCPQRKWAIKCFTREIPGLRERYQEISAYLRQAPLPFMVEFNYLERGIRIRNDWFPVLKMQWVEGFALNEFVKAQADKPQKLEVLSQLWVKLAERLRQASMAHCDLQHGNVLLVQGSKAGSLAVKLVDYDGMCVPSLTLLKTIEMGHPNFQHPQRARDGIYSLEVDRFSHLVIYLALRALIAGGKQLWERFDNGDNLLFRQADFDKPSDSELLTELLNAGDPTVRTLTATLRESLSKPLAQVPLLAELVGGASTVSVSTAVAKTPLSEPIPVLERVEDLYAEATQPVDDAAPAPRKPRRKPAVRAQKPLLLAIGAAGVLAAIGIVVGAIVLLSNKNAGKAKDAAAAQVAGEKLDQKVDSGAEPQPKPGPTPAPTPVVTVDPKPVVTVDPKPVVTVDPKPAVTVDPKPASTPAAAPAPEIAPKPSLGPKGALATDEVQRCAIDLQCTRLSVSAAGDRAVSFGGLTIDYWNLKTGELLQRISTKTQVNGVRLLADGRQALVTRSTGGVLVLDLQTAQTVREFGGGDGLAQGGVELSADGRRALTISSTVPAGGRAFRLHAWDVETGKELGQGAALTFPPQKGLSISADGRRALLDISGRPSIWEVDKGNLRTLAPSVFLLDMTLSADGRRALFTGPRSFLLWDVDKDVQIAKFDLTEQPGLLALSADGRYALVGIQKFRNNIALYDLEKRQEIKRYEGHSSFVRSLMFVPDGRHFLSSSTDRTMRLWRLPVEIADKKPDDKPATPVPAEQAAGKPITIRERLSMPVDAPSSVATLLFSKDGKRLFLAGDGSGSVHQWNASTGKPIGNPLSAHAGSIFSLGLSENNTVMFTSAVDRTAKLWSVASGKELSSHTGDVGFIKGALAPDGKTMIYGYRDAHVIDVASKQERFVLRGHKGYIRAFAFAPDNQTAAYAAISDIKLWNTRTGTEVANLVLGGSVHALAFSPDGKMLASGSADGTIVLWDVETHQQRLTLKGHLDPRIASLAYSADSKMLLSGADGTRGEIKLWATATGRELARLQGHTNGIASAVISPSDTMAASSGRDRMIRFWTIPPYDVLVAKSAPTK